jgi:ribosomal protein S18 acetylase RimI-like enzyme
MALYESLGFKKISKYRDSPRDDAAYYELQMGETGKD